MLNKETKQHIDNARDILVGQLPLPTDQVELITIALIYKFMDDIDVSAKELGGSATYFKGDLAQLSWRKIISNTLSAEERVTKFIASIESISKAKHIPDLFKSIFKNTFLKFRDGRILKMFMDEIDWFTYSHSEELGNAFEYLLNTMGAQGDNGQFRTPRNIIDFIVEVVEPKKTDSILDPACGTGGFLISAYKHILWANTKGYEDYSVTLGTHNIEGKKIHKGNRLTQDERKALVKNIVGYDITPLMQRLSKVNMYLHDISNPIIQDYDTLSLDTRWNEKFDCILANPPFMTPKGGVQPHDKFRIKANTTEVLFSDYMLEHLTPNGKAGWIVPEGIIFQNNNDYVDLRRWLVEEAGLWAVVSLPAQIFQPYSGVKTSILFIDRKLARERDSIILVKVENDGFSLNTNRNPIDKNDLPAALKLLRSYKSNTPPLGKGRTKEGSTEDIKYLILPRREFEKIDSYKAYTTGWELCKKAFVKVTAARAEYDEAKKNKLTENERTEKTWIRRWDDFRSRTNYNKAELGSETEFKTWFEENLKDACIGYGEDPHATIKMKKGSVYFPEELKKRIDNEREYNLSFEKYPDLKDSNIKNGKWPIVRIGEIAKITSGGTPPRNKPEYFKNGSIAWLKSGEVSQGHIEKAEEYITKEGLNNSSSKIIPANSVLVALYGATAGQVGILKFDAAINQAICAITANDKILPDFLFQVLKTKTQDLIRLSTGGAQQNLSQSIIKETEIPLPPLEIQQKIVAEIEGYQKVIDGCNAVIENYKPTFTIDEKWETVKLGEACEVDPPKPKISLAGDTMVDFLPMADLGFHVFSVVPSQKRKLDTVVKGYTYFAENDLLIAKITPCFENGKMGLVRKLEQGFGFGSTEYYVLRSSNRILPEYLFFVLNNPIFIEEGSNNMSGTAGQQRVTRSYINNFLIALPDLKTQQIIVNELKKDLATIEGSKIFKSKMESQIKEVIDGVWGKAE